MSSGDSYEILDLLRFQSVAPCRIQTWAGARYVNAEPVKHPFALRARARRRAARRAARETPRGSRGNNRRCNECRREDPLDRHGADDAIGEHGRLPRRSAAGPRDPSFDLPDSARALRRAALPRRTPPSSPCGRHRRAPRRPPSCSIRSSSHAIICRGSAPRRSASTALRRTTGAWPRRQSIPAQGARCATPRSPGRLENSSRIRSDFGCFRDKPSNLGL
jgi:hypothetical protein